MDAAKLGPISPDLHAALDRERSAAYSEGATTVWRMLGVADTLSDGGGNSLPNEAVFDEATGFYVVRPKAWGPLAADSAEPRTDIVHCMHTDTRPREQGGDLRACCRKIAGHPGDHHDEALGHRFPQGMP